MKKSLKMFVLAMGAMAFTSCGMVLPVAATSNPVGPKTGKAKATTVLGVFHVHGEIDEFVEAGIRWRRTSA